jgi:hypothetical protein
VPVVIRYTPAAKLCKTPKHAEYDKGFSMKTRMEDDDEYVYVNKLVTYTDRMFVRAFARVTLGRQPRKAGLFHNDFHSRMWPSGV